jgi:DNA-binding beta-propeller fold protein YncE
MSKGLNRAAVFAILPLMALAIAGAMRGGAAGKVAPPQSGVLAVANLRGESLSFIDIARPASPSTLMLGGPPHELLFTAGRLYATLGRANALVEVEPRAPAILRHLRLEGEPHGLALREDTLLVTLDRGDALVEIGRQGLLEQARTPMGHTPHAVAVSGRRVYVTRSGDARLALIGESPRDAPTGALPESVALSGEFVATADAQDGTLSVFRAATLDPLGRVDLRGRPVRVVDLGGDRVAVALNAIGQVAIVDLRRLQVIRRVDVLQLPDGICLSPDGAYAAVVSNAANAVQVFRVSDWRLAATYAAGDGPGVCLWLP